MVREVASKSRRGRRRHHTATVLAAAIVREGRQVRCRRMNPMDLNVVSISRWKPVADLVKELQRSHSNEEIAQVGTISANGDAEIGKFSPTP